MKATDIEDCDNCPLREDHCAGGMTSTPGGMPLEPPCVDWDDDTDLSEYIDGLDNYAYEEEIRIEKELEAEEERKQKQKIKNQRASESRWFVRAETREIKRLRKIITSNNSLNSLHKHFLKLIT